MSRRILFAAFVGLIVFSSIAAVPAKAAEVSWNKGNEWNYGWSATQEGMLNLSGTLNMTVTQATASEYITTLSGKATVSGNFMNLTTAGTATISGSIVRAKGSFATTSEVFIVNVSMTVSGFTTWVAIGVTTTASPGLNDLPINQPLAPGTHIWSNTTVTGKVWMNMPIMGNQTLQNISSTEHLEIIVGTNQTITTPAGTFECMKLTAGTGLNSTTYYYSEKVGNYVKMSGSGSMDTGYGALGNLTLKSYSYGSQNSGMSAFITGKYWWVTVLIVVIVVALIVGAVMMRRRGRAHATQPAPAQQTPPPPST